MTTLNQHIGDVSLPLDDASPVFPDPALDQLLKLFASAINAELSDRFTEAAAGTTLAEKNPVQSTLPLEPDPRTVREWKPGFPLLALHRFGPANYEEHTLTLEKRTQQWQLHYILSPGDVQIRRRLQGILTFVPSIVSLVIRRRGHASFEDGASQFGSGKGGLAALRIVSSEGGQARFGDEGDGALYLATTITLESVEIDGWNEGSFDEFEGATFTLDLLNQNESENKIEAFVIGDTDHVPPPHGSD